MAKLTERCEEIVGAENGTIGAIAVGVGDYCIGSTSGSAISFVKCRATYDSESHRAKVLYRLVEPFMLVRCIP